jgi:hypothetical protein
MSLIYVLCRFWRLGACSFKRLAVVELVLVVGLVLVVIFEEENYAGKFLLSEYECFRCKLVIPSLVCTNNLLICKAGPDAFFSTKKN